MKLVKESLNEIMHFERSDNPLVTLQVGKRVQIIKWLDIYEVTNYVINDDFTIDVISDVNLANKNLTKFPDFIKFNHISGYFDCYNNQLTSLVGCPSSVGGDFVCYNNKVQFTEEDVKKLSKVKNSIYV